MQRLTATLLVFALLSVASVGSVWAFGSRNFDASDRPMTQEQKAQMQQTWGKFMNEIQANRIQIATKMEQLQTLYAQPVPDKAQISALQNEIVDLRAAVAKQMIALQADLDDNAYNWVCGMGFGRHGGHGMGFGGYGGGRGMGFGGCGGPWGYGGSGYRHGR